MHIVESGEMTQSFFSNWVPNKDQSITVINTNEIARKLEAAYGIKSGSIRINTIMISNCERNVDDRRRRRRRRQLDKKKSEICGLSMSCKKEFADVIQAPIAAYIANILVEFKFVDGSSSELALIRCKEATGSSLNSLLRSRRAPKSTTEKATTPITTTAKATTPITTSAKVTTPITTTAKATAPTATTAKAATTSGKQLYVT
ncbi:unnamed protein product [Rotaria sordida]|uniref:Uncharacterized protein n=1 Tax=Rotaria sordida TaxID=392033 RepID=A0A819NJB4_9BILA|nr:unnamed protein product [Rotaria sordida]